MIWNIAVFYGIVNSKPVIPLRGREQCQINVIQYYRQTGGLHHYEEKTDFKKSD